MFSPEPAAASVVLEAPPKTPEQITLDRWRVSWDCLHENMRDIQDIFFCKIWIQICNEKIAGWVFSYPELIRKYNNISQICAKF